MKILKIKILSLLIISYFLLYNQTIANDLKVEANIKSWIYENTLEINLNSNDKDAKIFYYTDLEWRIDNQKEYKKENPIIIKESSTLSFHTIKWYDKASLINQEKYEINYSNKFELKIEKNKIIIKNTSNKIQNIWYWKVKWKNINKEIKSYTYIEKDKYIFLDYQPTNNEEILFISPDNKIRIKNIYKEPVLYKSEYNKEVDKKVMTNKINEDDKIVSVLENNKNEEIEINQITENTSKQVLNLSNNLKTSVINSWTSTSWEDDNFIIYLSILLIFFIIISQIFFNIEDLKSFIKNKIK